ncbi:DEAD/DEAH box helicase [Pectinatus sottacetonis]|uniref:DEAD/DEAH box helicase n=1 Tax=Pectinatus sottacetonis TaxID=1002795 RepID=UPI0018C54AC6|nr:DEAD/DEAH box helicase family protein [Pectinatus sottacetonis]
MDIIEKKFQNNLFAGIQSNGVYLQPEQIVGTWGNGIHDGKLRPAQIGAVCAIKSRWTIKGNNSTIVMPTGTGKTETMLAVIVAGKILRSLVVVPSDLLRSQLYEKFKNFGILYQIGVLDDDIKTPNVLKLEHSTKNFDEFKQAILQSNVIISTMSLLQHLSSQQVNFLADNVNLFMVDEAHHIASRTWANTKKWFLTNKILQFTATPFREDGEKVDGTIIYNFPLSLAQEQGYFKKIQFVSVEEYDDRKSDLAIATKAVSLLKKDIQAEYKHILLVRGNTITRANELFKIYNKKFSQYHPVLITNKQSKKEQQENLLLLKSLKSKILVCVDMFGEGIDIPNLKIAAIHDKYKSMPITLQFIGRFARAADGVGSAKIVANIADDNIVEAIEDLYSQDADWNKLLPLKADEFIDSEISLQKMVSGFQGNGIDKLNISQIRTKVSMIAYKTVGKQWHPDNWIHIFSSDSCRRFINQKEKIMIIVEPTEIGVKWTNQKDFNDLEWHLYIIYWNCEKNVVFLNATDKSKGYRLIKAIFDVEPKTIKSDIVFRSFSGIKRLMLGTVGLNSAIDGPVRYKMFAGIDVAEGISESQKANCVKSNLFGNGYNGKGRISIGASYKGTIWSRWIESIDFWKNWCNQIIDKVLDVNIDVKDILKGVLTRQIIKKLPSRPPYRIDWPFRLENECNENLWLSNTVIDIPFYESSIELCYNEITDEKIVFKVYTDAFEEKISFVIEPDGEKLSSISNTKLLIKNRRESKSLLEFFRENYPIIWFTDGSSLQGNSYVKVPTDQRIRFPKSNIIQRSWPSTMDITVESQLDKATHAKKPESIQYCMIDILKNMNKYEIIFDDDGAGEIADIVAIYEDQGNHMVVFDLFHCKYAHAKKTGARVSDLYEVCGQAEKSITWAQQLTMLLERMKYRERQRSTTANPSRFEVGNLHELSIMHKKALRKKMKMNIYIVQPGVQADKITQDMDYILSTAHSYCMDTFGIDLKLIC